MAKFNAATAVEALDFDFTAYGGPEGTVPEPSTGQINQFFKDVKRLMKDVKALQRKMQDAGVDPDANDEDVTDEQAEAMMEAIGDEAESFTDEMQEAMANALGKLCSDVPSAEQIAALPFRVQQAFGRWIMAEIRPKGEAPGSKN